MYSKYWFGHKEIITLLYNKHTLIYIFHRLPLFTGNVANGLYIIIWLKTDFFLYLLSLITIPHIQLNIFSRFFNKTEACGFGPLSRLCITVPGCDKITKILKNHPTIKPEQRAVPQYKIKRKEEFSSSEAEPSLLVYLYLLLISL